MSTQYHCNTSSLIFLFQSKITVKYYQKTQLTQFLLTDQGELFIEIFIVY